MRARLFTIRLVPAYATLATILFGFVAGSTMAAREYASEGISSGDPMANWLEPALDTAFGAMIFGVPLIIGAMLRFFAYRRFENRFGTARSFAIPVLVGEAVVFLLAAWFIWQATGPEEDAGWLWLFYAYLGGAVLIASAIALAVSLSLKQPDGMAGRAATLPPA